MIPPRSQKEYDEWIRSEKERLDREHNVIHSLSELRGWDIIRLERWKKGVVRYHAYRAVSSGGEFKCGFAKDEVFAALQLPPSET